MPERYNTIIPQCHECGEPHQGNWQPELSAELLERQLCWWCYFWLRHVARSNEPDQARIRGELYHIRPEDPRRDPRGLGFGGAPFHIRFLDGRPEPCVRTTNLWACGPIPEAFQARLPDNAIFTDAHWQEEPQERTPDPTWVEGMAYVNRVLGLIGGGASRREGRTGARP